MIPGRKFLFSVFQREKIMEYRKYLKIDASNSRMCGLIADYYSSQTQIPINGSIIYLWTIDKRWKYYRLGAKIQNQNHTSEAIRKFMKARFAELCIED